MKIGVYKYTVHLSARSVVNGVANSAEIYAKKLMFGEESIKVGDLVRTDDVDSVEVAERLRVVLPGDLHEKMLGTFKEDWEANMKKFEFKESKSKKSAKKSDDDGSDASENGSEE